MLSIHTFISDASLTPAEDQQESKEGKFHDQGDAKWIVFRRPLGGHNETPFGQPTPGRPIGRPGVGHPSGECAVLSYY
jgi:hypothetical protein